MLGAGIIAKCARIFFFLFTSTWVQTLWIVKLLCSHMPSLNLCIKSTYGDNSKRWERCNETLVDCLSWKSPLEGCLLTPKLYQTSSIFERSHVKTNREKKISKGWILPYISKMYPTVSMFWKFKMSWSQDWLWSNDVLESRLTLKQWILVFMLKFYPEKVYICLMFCVTISGISPIFILSIIINKGPPNTKGGWVA